MLKRLKHRIRNAVNRKTLELIKSTSGVAAIEFALIFPIFITIFYGVSEISYYNMMSRRAQMSVDFAAEYMSRDADNIFTVQERWTVEDIWQVVNTSSFNNSGGDAYTNSRGKYSRALSAVEFTQTPAGCVGAACSYVPSVQWAFLATQGISSPKRRNCAQTVVPNHFKLDEHKIPEGVTGRSAIVVSDFVYKYTPLIDVGFIGQQEKHLISIRKSRGGQALAHPGQATHVVYC